MGPIPRSWAAAAGEYDRLATSAKDPKIASAAPPGVSSLSTLMIPIVGVFSGIWLLGESPRWQEYAALVLVIASLATVLIPPRRRIAG